MVRISNPIPVEEGSSELDGRIFLYCQRCQSGLVLYRISGGHVEPRARGGDLEIYLRDHARCGEELPRLLIVWNPKDGAGRPPEGAAERPPEVAAGLPQAKGEDKDAE